jgi:hypothetical protein
MANAVVEANEIFLNGVYYPTTRPVRSTLASIYPAKVVIGDTSKDSNLRSSIIAWSDWRGGIGTARMEGAGEVNRAWFSECQLRYKNHLVLPGLVTETTTPNHSISGATIGAINTLSDEVYAFWNGTNSESPVLFKYNNATSSWGDALTQSAVDQVTDSIVYTAPSGTTYLVFAHYDSNGSGITYSSNGSTWKTDTNRGARFLVVWDERLWAITNGGKLWYITGDLDTDSSVDNDEVLDAQLPTPSSSITKLFVARNAIGVPIIYASTTQGIFAHNADNAMWEATQMDFPVHPDNGKGTVRWRDSVYIPSGNGIYKYINGNNSAVITIMGPDRDDGLPANKRGAIRHMAGSHNELLIGLDASAAPATVAATSLPYRWVSHHGARTLEPSTGFSSILGYNDMGWEAKWVSGTAGKSFDAIHLSDAYSKYRVWWGHNDIIHFMDLPKDIINPSEVSEFAYATSAIHETPWFNAGQSEVDKLALSLRTEAQDLTADETVKVEYAVNYSETYYDIDDDPINASAMGGASGTHVHVFGSKAGTAFRSIRFRLTLDRSTATSTGLEKFNTPDVVSLTLEYRKKIAAKWGHTVDVDLTNEYKGNVPKDLRSNLISAIESTTLVEFTFRDDGGGTRNYYVDVIAAQGMEFTGHDERGSTTITVVEP